MSAIYDAIGKHQKVKSQIKEKAMQMIGIFKLTAKS
jgi:hypothetical protein